MNEDFVDTALRMAAATRLMAKLIAEYEMTEDERCAAGDILELIGRRIGIDAVKAST